MPYQRGCRAFVLCGQGCAGRLWYYSQELMYSGALRAIEVDGSALSGLIEVVDLGLTDFTSKMQLMCALRPGEIVVEMSGDVIPSRRAVTPVGSNPVLPAVSPERCRSAR